MNSLETYIRDQKLDPRAALDTLQSHGVISDNCVTPADVFGPDTFAAILFLSKQKAK